MVARQGVPSVVEGVLGRLLCPRVSGGAGRVARSGGPLALRSQVCSVMSGSLFLFPTILPRQAQFRHATPTIGTRRLPRRGLGSSLSHLCQLAVTQDTW